MLRNAILADCNDIYELVCGLENERLPHERFAEIYKRQLNNGNFCCIVFEQDGRIIGMLNLRFEEQLHHAGKIAEIMEFSVDADYRHKGIGKAMLTFAKRMAKENECTQIEVACNRLRQDAHCFYEREGLQNTHYRFSKAL